MGRNQTSLVRECHFALKRNRLLIEPSALLSVVALSAMIQFGVTPRMNPALFMPRYWPPGVLFYEMHLKRRNWPLSVCGTCSVMPRFSRYRSADYSARRWHGCASRCFLEAANVVSWLDGIAWDPASVLSASSITGRVLHKLVGYMERPTQPPGANLSSNDIRYSEFVPQSAVKRFTIAVDTGVTAILHSRWRSAVHR